MSKFDIYISYSPNDNKPIQRTAMGWVDIFHSYLEQALIQILKRKPTFLSVHNQEKPPVKLIKETKVIISILSPEYIDSTYCLEDIHILAENDKAIFKVVKLPVDGDKEPSQLRQHLAYPFYGKIEKTDETFEIEDFFSKDAERFFWTNLTAIATDISKVLSSGEDNNIKIGGKGLKVYLGKASREFQHERNSIKRELVKCGCTVLPDENYPLNKKELEVYISKNLEKSDFSIHLLGNGFGEDEDYDSIKGLEQLLSSQQAIFRSSEIDDSLHRNYRRFIWIDPDLKQDEERQKLILENFLRNSDTLEHCEILQTPLEEFKFLIKKKIDEHPRQSVKDSKYDDKKLYLIYNKVDYQAGKELAELFKRKRLQTLEPLFQGSLLEIRHNHLENLSNCDYAIIYAGKVDEKWVFVKYLDLLKATGSGRKSPIAAKTILLDSICNINLGLFQKSEVDIIKIDTTLVESVGSHLSGILNYSYE